MPAPVLAPAGAPPAITEPDFERFCEFFYRKSGIHFDEAKRYFVEKRLQRRMAKTGHGSFREYFTLLRFEASGEELQALINELTVTETYFFREEYQFETLVECALDEVVAARGPGATIRIWSIPSSTGEEPYSIAIYLLEHWAALDRVDVEIVSSDINTSVLERAMQGVYNRRAIQNLPERLLAKYFEPVAGGHYRICEDLRASVRFTKLNLNDPRETRSYRHFDVIFCRNLLIYFDEASRREAANVFFDALRPGGFVFLGHSESMSRISSLFKVRRFPKAIAYQKPVA